MEALYFFKDLLLILEQEIHQFYAPEFGSFEKLTDKENCQR